MKEVLWDSAVRKQLKELSFLLVNNGYFGSMEYATAYIDEIIDHFSSPTAFVTSKKAPAYFNKYGDNIYYAIYHRNNRLSWYAFYEENETSFIIRLIANNYAIGHHLTDVLN
ncbi:MAG: hypothetical protein IKN59_07510 [Paludibacteraceae bacterium]|nr:hypothetical protein [Paludibacteraceae bacterium]